MPLLKVDEVASFVISDDKIWEHLKRNEHRRSQLGFRDFASQFGIHDLGEISESQLMALVAARNTAPIIDLLRIPSGKSQYGSGMATYDLHRRKTSLAPSITELLASAPTSEQEWEVLRDPEDIPQAIPEDLLLRRLAPQEFLRRLTEGELLRNAWIQDDYDSKAQQENETQDKSNRPEQGATTEDARPYGYLLLDASESMGSGRDRRDEVARGLALAYLLSQFESGNPTVLYLFRHELSPAFGGESRTAFESAVCAILSHSHEGMTNLQGALKLLSEAMRVHHGRVDIALITDGVTRLTANPVEGSHLHTFLVGVRPEEFDKFGAEQYQESLIQLRSWSDFMFRIDPDIMKTASIPRREDVLDFGRMLFGLEEEAAACASPDKVRRVQTRLNNLFALIARYREYHGSKDSDVERLWDDTLKAVEKVGRADAEAVAKHNLEGWTNLDRDLMLSLETRELRTVLDPEVLGAKWGAVAIPAEVTSPWENLKAILRYVKRKVRGAMRRVKRILVKNR